MRVIEQLLRPKYFFIIPALAYVSSAGVLILRSLNCLLLWAQLWWTETAAAQSDNQASVIMPLLPLQASWYLTNRYNTVDYVDPNDTVKAWFNPK